MISFLNVSKIYSSSTSEVRALDDLTLEIAAGEFVAVTGHSGSGKSTLLALAGGLALPSGGRVTVDGFEVSAASSAERAKFRAEKLGFVFQMFHLLPYLTILDNVLVAAANRNAEARDRAEQLVKQFGLTDRRSHRPGQLSAGERQRVALARALINQPRVLLADEPTGNLDKVNTDVVMNHLCEFQQAGGTILLVTHDHAAASRASRAIEMRKGQIVEAVETGEPVAAE